MEFYRSILYILSSFRPSYLRRAEAATYVLNQWYNQSTGLWDTTGWWNSANCLNTLINLATIDNAVGSTTYQIISNTYIQAQKHTLYMSKNLTNGMIQCFYGNDSPSTIVLDDPPVTKSFLNDYYDDEGWWALAWIAAYDFTKERQYLTLAETIFEDMATGWTTPCGGIWWDKHQTYVSAISNELFLSVAASLANRSEKKSHYRSWAQRQWSWFERSGMKNAQNTINDGLDLNTCGNNNGIVWSYNQGVILGGLVELSHATSDPSFLDSAESIAVAAIKALTDVEGVLHDQCEPDCGADGSQFKGIFMRNLQKLAKVAPNPLFKLTIERNANTIWRDNRDANNQLSVVWSGPFISPANASTQSSAMDALIGAAALYSTSPTLSLEGRLYVPQIPIQEIF